MTQSARNILFKGGAIVTMDAKIANLATGDVLVQGDRIAAIGANIEAGDAEVIDACNQHGLAMIFTGRRHFKH